MVETTVSVVTTLWTNFHNWHPGSLVLYTMLIISCLSAILITRMTGAIALIAIPASFVILYYSAMLCNYAAVSVPMVAVGEMQKALIFSVIGHFIGGLLILGIFRVAQR